MRAGAVCGVVCNRKVLLGGLYVGTGCELGHGHAGTKNLRHVEVYAVGHGPFLRQGVEEQAHGVVELVEAYFEVGD